MHTVVVTGPGRVELNYMWLPTFIGLSSIVKKKMEDTLKEKVVGITLDEAGLDKVDDLVKNFILQEFPAIKGLDLYLDAMKFVEL